MATKKSVEEFDDKFKFQVSLI